LEEKFMKIHTETLVIRLSPRLKQKLENDSWLRKMSMAEYLRAFIEKENAESGTRKPERG